MPTWAQIGLAGLVAGGPTFVGALVFALGELWSVLEKTGVTIAATSMVAAGFAVAFVTEPFVDVNGGRRAVRAPLRGR